MALTDDDYPVLEFEEDDSRTPEGLGEVVGRPPNSDVESDEDDTYHTPSSPNDEENQEYQFNGTFDYDSGSDTFDAEAYENEQAADVHIHELPSVIVGKEQDISNNQTIEEFDKNTLDFFKVLLPSAMVAKIELMTSGFEPTDINQCLRDVGYCLEFITQFFIGTDEYEKLPKKAEVEWCYALVKAGWLDFDSDKRKFFPKVPEHLRNHCTSLIEGSRKLLEHEATIKKKAETYPSEECELRVLHAFNMIAELLNAVREQQQQFRIKYSCLSNAYNDMVRGHKYQQIYEKYKQHLDLDPNKQWNPTWFNQHVHRSSLLKFFHMSRFSEIVVTDTAPNTFYFRADDENNREVKLFTKNDFDEVRDKWRSGNQGNRNFGNNYGSGGQRGENRPQKKQLEKDPNYRAARFNAENVVDDGSLEPTTSARYNDRNSSPRPIRNRSPSSPIRDRSPSPYAPTGTTSNAQQNLVRASSPESQRSNHSQRSARPNPFGGRPVQQRQETRHIEPPNSRENRGSYGGTQTKDIQRVDNRNIGNSSSEGEFTSDGSYSDEDEETKAAKRAGRLEAKKRKEEREMRRRKQHEEIRNKPIGTNRFSTSQFSRHPSPQNSERTRTTRNSEHRSASRSDNESRTPELPQTRVQTPVQTQHPVQSSLQQQNPQQTFAPRSQRSSSSDEDEPKNPPRTNKAPAAVSSNMHNEHSHQAQLPYRPAPSDVDRKKREEKEKQANLQKKIDRKKAANEGIAQHPYMVGQNSEADLSEDNQDGYVEPPAPGGFGNSQNSNTMVVHQHGHPNQRQENRPFNEEYRGKNQRGSSQATNQQHHYQPQYQQQSSQQFHSQQSFLPPQNVHQIPQQRPLSREPNPNHIRQMNPSPQDYNHPMNSQGIVRYQNNGPPMNAGQIRDGRYDGYTSDFHQMPHNRNNGFAGNGPPMQQHPMGYNNQFMNQQESMDRHSYHQQQPMMYNGPHHSQVPSSSNQSRQLDQWNARAPSFNAGNQGPPRRLEVYNHRNQQNHGRDDDTLSEFNVRDSAPPSQNLDLEDNFLRVFRSLEDGFRGVDAEALKHAISQRYNDFPLYFDPFKFIHNRLRERIIERFVDGRRVYFSEY